MTNVINILYEAWRKNVIVWDECGAAVNEVLDLRCERAAVLGLVRQYAETTRLITDERDRANAAVRMLAEALNAVLGYMDSVEGQGEGGQSHFDVPALAGRAALSDPIVKQILGGE